VFEMENGEVQYDDATLVARTWEELAISSYDLPGPKVSADEARARRAEAIRRLALRKAT
jgi:hypothetical protein